MFDARTDALTSGHPSDAAEGWFDRWYFNVHSAPGEPYLLIGAGIFPVRGTVDGYAMYIDGRQQLNVRFAGSYEPGDVPTSVGPLSWETIEPMNLWSIRLDDNPSGLTFDLQWNARGKLWNCETISFDTGRDTVIAFDHGFQSGRHSGSISYGGASTEVKEWFGQRDRSRGVRAVGGGQGLHLWIQGQFDDEAVSFMLDLKRSNEVLIRDGAVLGEDGSVDEITEAHHDLHFDDALHLTRGTFRLGTESGRLFDLEVDATQSGGGYLSGGGYGGSQGALGGEATVSFETWDLESGEYTARTLDTPMVDRLSSFTLRENGRVAHGAGIAEFSHSRSSKYTYERSIELTRA